MALLFTRGPILLLIPVDPLLAGIPSAQNMLIQRCGAIACSLDPFSSIQPIGLLMSGYASNTSIRFLVGCGRRPSRSASGDSPLPWRVLAVVHDEQLAQHHRTCQQQNTAGILSWEHLRQPVGFLIFGCCAGLPNATEPPFRPSRGRRGSWVWPDTSGNKSGMEVSPFSTWGSIHQSWCSRPCCAVLYLGGLGLPISGGVVSRGDGQVSMPLSCR